MKPIVDRNFKKILNSSDLSKLLGGREVIRTETHDYSAGIHKGDKIVYTFGGARVKTKIWDLETAYEPSDDFVENYGDDYYQL